MINRRRREKRNESKRSPGRFTLLFCAVSFVALLSTFFFDYVSSAVRLSDASIERALARFSVSEESSRSFSSDAPRSRAELDSVLTNAAQRYVQAADDRARAERVVERGLTRWDSESSEQSGCFCRERADDYCASQSAIDALAALEYDSALESAVDFLRDLDGEFDAENATADYRLWAFDVNSNNPLDAVGVVSMDDFVGAATAERASRLAYATAKLFFWITLGFFAPGARIAAFWRTLSGAGAFCGPAVLRRRIGLRDNCAQNHSLLALSSVRLLI